MEKELLTHSRSTSFRRCRRRHWYEYEMGLRPIADARALRMGSAYHLGLESVKAGRESAWSVFEYYQDLAQISNGAPHSDYEPYTVAALLNGYVWRWNNAPLVMRASEQSFRLPLINPATDAPSTRFDLAGKIDGICLVGDGRGAVLEHKLLSDSLDPDSDFRRRLLMDPQISLYVHAARRLGHDVSTVLYDVTRKPTIKPTPVPILDHEGLKIVHDQKGERQYKKDGKPYQAGNAAKGWEVQTRPMTPVEWGAKLIADIEQRPDYYFARIEVACLDDEIQECMTELWELQKTLRDAQRHDRWYRNVSRDTCSYCPFFGLCSSKQQLNPDEPPEGFHYLADVHPELEMEVS